LGARAPSTTKSAPSLASRDSAVTLSPVAGIADICHRPGGIGSHGGFGPALRQRMRKPARYPRMDPTDDKAPPLAVETKA